MVYHIWCDVCGWLFHNIWHERYVGVCATSGARRNPHMNSEVRME